MVVVVVPVPFWCLSWGFDWIEVDSIPWRIEGDSRESQSLLLPRRFSKTKQFGTLTPFHLLLRTMTLTLPPRRRLLRRLRLLPKPSGLLRRVATLPSLLSTVTPTSPMLLVLNPLQLLLPPPRSLSLSLIFIFCCVFAQHGYSMDLRVIMPFYE